MLQRSLLSLILLVTLFVHAAAFQVPQPKSLGARPTWVVQATGDDGVVELADEEETATKEEEEKAVAPFLSQGEISEEALEMDFSDPKQARVMFYIILSLLPVLFLIPLMLGSRDLVPPEMLPPVQM